jgi:predicted ATP-grasp superfamily ATP-dependent carboligase
MQESKYIFVFSELINAENKSVSISVGKVFLMIKLGPGLMVHFSTLSLSCGGNKRKIDDQNIDMIFILLTS